MTQTDQRGGERLAETGDSQRDVLHRCSARIAVIFIFRRCIDSSHDHESQPRIYQRLKCCNHCDNGPPPLHADTGKSLVAATTPVALSVGSRVEMVERECR